MTDLVTLPEVEGDFTTDWVSKKARNWSKYTAHLRDQPVRVLEIGSWEGRSAIMFLELLPLSRITCVETFEGSDEHRNRPGWLENVQPFIEPRFDRNVARFGNRVVKIKLRSVIALEDLYLRGITFDLIYVDGSHMRDDVLIDALLAWRVLKVDGIMIFDDYRGKSGRMIEERPREAIDVFLLLHDNHVKLHRDGQVIVMKTRFASRRFAARILRRAIRLFSGH